MVAAIEQAKRRRRTMRLEAMGRDGGALVKAAQAAVKLTLHMGGTGVNIPNKAKKDSPMRMLHELASALPADSLRLLCMHYSMKHNYAGSSAKTKAAFENFCDEARRRNVGQILLVSGAGPRPFDSVACLQQLSLPQENCPEIGVAFNPYIPDRAAREKERARLRLKVNTGRVSCIWLQLGSDLQLLADGLSFVRALPAVRESRIRIYGSIFVPSKRLIANMRFRPWSGVYLSDEYLFSVAAAEEITARILQQYAAAAVEVLVETAVVSAADWDAVQRLVRRAESLEASTSPLTGPPAKRIRATAQSDLHTGAPRSQEPEDNGRGAATAVHGAASSSPEVEAGHLPSLESTEAGHTDSSECQTSITENAPVKEMRQHVFSAAAAQAMNTQTDAAPAAAAAEPSGASDSRKTLLVWFRAFDLRLSDHAPLAVAARAGGPVVCAFVWPRQRGRWGVHGAQEAWLRASLARLDSALRAIGSRLILRCAPSGLTSGFKPGSETSLSEDSRAEADLIGGNGRLGGGLGEGLERDAIQGLVPPPPTSTDGENNALVAAEAASVAAEMLSLANECDACEVLWHRSYEPDEERVERAVSAALHASGRRVREMPGRLLYEPHTVNLSGGFNGGHWGTLMPFLRACERQGPPPPLPLPPPTSLPPPANWPASLALEGLCLAPRPVRADGTAARDWATELLAYWDVSEEKAREQMELFVHAGGLQGYETRRSRADVKGTVSTLSPYLRFGQLSPRQLYHAVKASPLPRELKKTFSRRLHWRDLAYFHLSAFPDMPSFPIRRHYAAHAWIGDSAALRRWQRGQTGFPMVDASMRCLYATGWLHQSLRMVVASFLVEYLGINWTKGAEWFHDTLVDADVGINSMMWQNAGRSGIDQWNFVLSPESGSQDPSGAFCRTWLPELAKLPTKQLHTPWLASPQVLAAAGIELGVNYPHRMVADLTEARSRTVSALTTMRAASLEWNDDGGYDQIQLPNGQRTRVFTKQEFRLDKQGKPKPPPAARATPPGKGGSRAAGRASGKPRTNGVAPKGRGAGARSSRIVDYFPKSG